MATYASFLLISVQCLATLGLNNPAVATLVTNVDGRMLSKNDRTVRASAAF